MDTKYCTNCVRVDPATMKPVYWANGKAHATIQCDVYKENLKQQQVLQGEMIRLRYKKFWE